MRKAASRRGDNAARVPETEISQRLEMDAASQPALLTGSDLEAAFSMFGAQESRVLGEFDDWAPAFEAANDERAKRLMPHLASRGLHIDSRLPVLLLKILDWLVVALAAEMAVRWGSDASLAQMPFSAALPALTAMLMLKAGLWLTDAYRATPATIRPDSALGGLTLGAFIALLCANVLAANARDAGALSAVAPAAAALLAGIHAAFALWVRAAHKKGLFAETIVLIGATEAAGRFVARAQNAGDARVVAIADDRLTRAPFRIGQILVGGDVDALLAWPGLPFVDRIVIAVTPAAEARVRDIIARLKLLPNRVDLLLDYDAQSVQGHGADQVAGAAVVRISGFRRNPGRALLKRAQDLILGALLAALLALPMAAIAIAVKFESKGPVFFRQRRHGFNNSVFTALKFRTMRGGVRVTSFGAFLRRSGLDNLPQLINVLRGEMSLVGPRPHDVGLQIANRELTDIVAVYAHRHQVKPGITGWAQLNGACGQPQAAACVRKCVRLDLDYIARASFLFDMEILARTVLAVFSKRR